MQISTASLVESKEDEKHSKPAVHEAPKQEVHPVEHEREMTPEKLNERSMAGSPVHASQELDSPKISSPEKKEIKHEE